MKQLNKQPKRYDHFLVVDEMLSPRKLRVEQKTVPPGIYELQIDQARNLYLCPTAVSTDEIIPLTDSTSKLLIDDVKAFFTPEVKARFKEMGFVYKRGQLIHGKPGTGKTATIHQLSEFVTSIGGIVILNPSPTHFATIAKQIKDIQPDLLFLVVWEDFEKMCDNAAFLSLLDGQDSVDNTVFVATTNYIDRVPPRLTNRRSRFALVKEIKALPDAVREHFLRAKLKGEELNNITKWMKGTEGMVIDQIKDLIQSVYCLNIGFEEAVRSSKGLEVKPEETTFTIKTAVKKE